MKKVFIGFAIGVILTIAVLIPIHTVLTDARLEVQRTQSALEAAQAEIESMKTETQSAGTETPKPTTESEYPKYFYEDGQLYAYYTADFEARGLKTRINDGPSAVQKGYTDTSGPEYQIPGPFN
jgi:hypothetical protein